MGLLEQHADKWEPEPMSGCFLWTGFAQDVRGYLRPKIERHTTVARAVLLESKGPPPTDKHHCSHKCDVSICVNPEHLCWETVRENNNRMSTYNRHQLWMTKGFYFDKTRNRYRAHIRIARVHKHLGWFKTSEEARSAYLAAVGECV